MKKYKFKPGDIVMDDYGQWEYVRHYDTASNILGIFKPIGNFYTPYPSYSDGTYPLDIKHFKLVRSKYAKNYQPNWL